MNFKKMEEKKMQIQDIAHYLKDWFSFPKKQLYCQVATVGYECAHIRTMNLYDFTNEGFLIFVTDTASKKWSDIQNYQNTSVCMLNPDLGQIIVEGNALLKTSTNDLDTVTMYWNNFIDEYWRNFYLQHSANSTALIPESFGVIMIKPYLWDILTINQSDYLKSSRKQFQLMNNAWILQECRVI